MKEKWIELERRLQDEPSILPNRAKAARLWQAYQDDRLSIIEQDGVIVAMAAIWESPHNAWDEVGTIWVSPNCRGQGLARVVFHDALSKLRELDGMGAFLITYNPGVAEMTLAAGWVETTWDDPVIPPEAIAGRRFRHTPTPDGLERRLFRYLLRAAASPPAEEVCSFKTLPSRA